MAGKPGWGRLHEFRGQSRTLTQWSVFLGVSINTLYNRINSCGWTVNEALSGRRSPKFEEDYFSIIDTEEKAYWFGMLMADGCVYRRGRHNSVIFGLKSEDGYHVQRFQDAIRLQKKLYIHKESGLVSCRVESRLMCDDLERHGCVPKKSLILNFPPSSSLPGSLLRHFVRGYFDGDGTIYFYGSRTRIEFCGTRSFLSTLSGLLPCSYRPVSRGGRNIFRLVYSAKADIKTLINWMYKGASICLLRKRDRAMKGEK